MSHNRYYKRYLEPNCVPADRKIPRSTKCRQARKYFQTTSNEKVKATASSNYGESTNSDSSDADISFKNQENKDISMAGYSDEKDILMVINDDAIQQDAEDNLDIDNDAFEQDEANVLNCVEEDDGIQQEDFYEKHQLKISISKKDILTLILAFSLRYQVSDTAILSLIEMVNIIIGQEFISPSLYRLWKMFSCSQEDIVKTHFFCEKCHTYISHIDKKITVCSTCGNKVQTSDVQKSSCFLSVSLEAQIKNLINSGTLSIPYIQDFNKSMNVHNQVSDINHGKLYKKLRNENESLFLTYNFSVDGLAVFNSAKGSLWPILVVINEIPPTLRYQNVLLAGIWFGKKEPKMDLYLKPFVEEAVKLGENGISFGPNSKHTIKVFAACCCADSVARPCIQNSTQFNGYYGCTWCKHPGVLVNSVVKYSYKDHLLYEDRREQETIKLMFEAMQKGKSIQGVKGPSILLPIPCFNVVNGFVPDYMHGIFLGVTKHLVSSWFDTRNKSYNFYLGSPTMCGLINDRMSRFIFPHNVGRIPRGISERALYKASEWKNFLLFICFPCIKDIQKQAYLDHVSLLVGAVEILMQNVITVDDLKTVDCLLLKFVTETQLLYGEDFMTSNIHLLLHYTTSIANWGPLWCHSMFVYEGYNATLQSYIMGTRGVKTQTIRRFLLNQELISNLNKYPVHVSNFISKINLKSKHSQKFIKIGNFNLYGAPHTQVKDICSTNFPTGFFLLNGLTENANIQYFKRMTIENMLFSTKSDKHLRRSDSFIYTQSGFGKIIFIALHLNITKVVVCIQKYEVTKPNKNIGNMYIVKNSDNFVILDPNEIVGKCVEYVDNSGVITISKVPVSHELCT